MKDQNIVMLCQQNWDTGIGFNAKNLAKEFAKDNRVLFVNMPLDVNTMLKGFGQPEVKNRLRIMLGRRPGLVQVEPNVWVLTPGIIGLSINWLASRDLFNALNRWNSRLLAGSIVRAVRKLSFDSYTLLQDGLIFQGLELKQLLAPRTSVYYLRDYMLAVPYFQRHGTWVEPQLMRQVDVVAANSAYLTDYARQYTPRSYDIGQGCVLAHYRPEAAHPVPADLAGISRPIIGYTGFLTGSRLDIDLLLSLARQRPQWRFVLVGPEDDDFRQSALHELPNVHFLGRKDPVDLGAYLQYFDVCINFQVINQLTVGNYPLKIDEYLAMGKPVVATATRTMELFADHVYLATSPEQWLHLLGLALTENDPARRQARIEFARSHTWEASVQALYAALRDAQKAA
ncbi:glycosyltransferase [Hymenobacter negativus]|uniref:Glycosyltransferase n=1 Tax=Hymenobacter negativus TaxID=2795026 RepID=A0ABS3QAI1_9BACT|nr:glycosyltransferase [Hymenobacter negativus]MBO2008263.1 glycosyltransferase [Hymenobacter negativus]